MLWHSSTQGEKVIYQIDFVNVYEVNFTCKICQVNVL